jgi:large subunit ribosomal protein L9
MEVILRQAVESLGKPGDVVKVSNGYARNYLLPHGVAFEATPGREAAQAYATKLEQVQLTFSARVGDEGKLFGSVTSADVAQQLESQGFHIEKRQIDLHEPIKALGVYRIPIRLHADVKPEIRVWVIKA